MKQIRRGPMRVQIRCVQQTTDTKHVLSGYMTWDVVLALHPLFLDGTLVIDKVCSLSDPLPYHEGYISREKKMVGSFIFGSAEGAVRGAI